MDTATTEIYTLSLHDALPILVPGALAEAVIVGHQLPGVAAIIGAVDAALLGLDDGPHAIRISAGNGYAEDRKSTRLNSSHPSISYAVFCLKKKNVMVNKIL